MSRRRRRTFPLVLALAAALLVASAGTAEARWGRRRTTTRFEREHPILSVVIMLGLIGIRTLFKGSSSRSSTYRGRRR